jgi:hypothetical protein
MYLLSHFRIFDACNVCMTGETLLGKVKQIPNLSSDLGAPTGLSEVRWTRTTVGGPNDLGGSVTACSLEAGLAHRTLSGAPPDSPVHPDRAAIGCTQPTLFQTNFSCF